MIGTLNSMSFLNEKIAKKLLKNEKLGKQFSARIISDTLGADYDEVYNNITLTTDEIAFTALTIGSVADAVYYDDTCYFNIEINGYSGESKRRQLESCVYQLSLGQLHSYKDYYKMKKVVQISIDSFDFLGFGDFMYNAFLMDDLHYKKITDKLHIVHINIDYLRKMDYNNVVNSNNQLMKDLYFLICGSNQLDMVMEKSDSLMKKVIKEAKKIADINQMDLYLTDEEMRENDRKHDIEVATAKGIKQGREENQRDMIIALYQNGASLDLICKSSGLSLEKVQQIIETYDKN